MRDNKGFSLIEIIIVVAIIGIVLGVAATSIFQIFSMNSKQCASELSAIISRCKIACVSRSNVSYVKLYQNDEGVYVAYVEGGGEAEVSKIGKSNLTVNYTDSAGTVFRLKEKELYISFRRTDGSLLGMADSEAAATDEALTGSNITLKEISISSGSSTRRLTFAALTGKHYVGS